ncbi:hypothetical protein ACOV11_25915, partial [Vibrio natriegens]
GVAYVWDQFDDFATKLNPELVDLDPLDSDDQALLRDMLTKHVEYTGSTVAQTFLAHFEANLGKMVKVMPRDYKAALEKRKAEAEQATVAEADVADKDVLEAIDG